MSEMKSQNAGNGQEQTVYGFMDPTTNVFYAFQDVEQYRLFLEWVKLQNHNHASPNAHHPSRDDQLLEDFDRATQDIMSIFEDPFFHKNTQTAPHDFKEIQF